MLSCQVQHVLQLIGLFNWCFGPVRCRTWCTHLSPCEIGERHPSPGGLSPVFQLVLLNVFLAQALAIPAHMEKVSAITVLISCSPLPPLCPCPSDPVLSPKVDLYPLFGGRADRARGAPGAAWSILADPEVFKNQVLCQDYRVRERPKHKASVREWMTPFFLPLNIFFINLTFPCVAPLTGDRRRRRLWWLCLSRDHAPGRGADGRRSKDHRLEFE